MKLDDFLAIEKKYGLIEDKLDGFAYWTFFRTDLEWELEVQKNSYGEAHVQPMLSFGKQLQRLGKRFCYLLFFHRLPSISHDVMILNHERRVWIEDHYECIYTDKIAEAFPDAVVLERPYFQEHFRPVKTKNLVYTDWITLKASLFYLLNQKLHPGKYSQIQKELKKRIEKPVDEICRAYGIKYSLDSILEKMVCGYYVYHSKKKDFARVLKRVKPKIILEVVGYNIDCMIINELAAQANIPTVELQHGTTGAEHISYNYYDGVNVLQFAKYFFAFSEFWKEAARFPLQGDFIKVVGFPYMEQKARQMKAKVNKEGKQKILFISQGVIGKRLSEIAVELHQLMNQEEYEIIYKLHPGEYAGWQERYQGLAASDITVIDTNQTDLYELFAGASYQVAAYGSTATFEGLQFELETFVLREKASSELQMLCDKGIAEYFDTAQELCQQICEHGKTEKTAIKFWADDALETIISEIKKIMKHI